MSATAKRLMDSFFRESPQYTRGLRADTFMLEPSKTREFERAMAELQQGLWIVKTEERYEPSFSYRWDLFSNAGCPTRSRKAGSSRGRPRSTGCSPAYLGGAVYSTPPAWRGCSAWGEGDGAGRGPSRASGPSPRGRRVPGWPGSWVVSPLMEAPPGFRYIDIHTHLHPSGWGAPSVGGLPSARPGSSSTPRARGGGGLSRRAREWSDSSISRMRTRRASPGTSTPGCTGCGRAYLRAFRWAPCIPTTRT